jgi:hypothetical protein
VIILVKMLQKFYHERIYLVKNINYKKLSVNIFQLAYYVHSPIFFQDQPETY